MVIFMVVRHTVMSLLVKKYQMPFFAFLCAISCGGMVFGGCARQPVSSHLPSSTEMKTGSEKAATSLIDEGDMLLAAGRIESAEAFFERAIRIEPREPEPWYAMAKAKLMQGQNQQAIQFCLKTMALLSKPHPLRRQCWKLMAEAYSNMGQEDMARDALEKAHAAR